MNSKLVCVLFLAIGLTQAANIQPKPEPRDLRVVIVNVITILKIVGEKVETGIEEAKPTIDELEAELNPALATHVENLLLKIEGIVNEVIDRIRTLEKEVTDGIAAIETEAASCVSAVDKDLDALLDPAEAKIAGVISEILENNKANITNLETQIRNIITTLDAATDKAIATGISCVKKGSKNVKTCLDDNTDAWNAAVQTAVINLTLAINELVAYLPLLLQENIDKIKPIVDQFLLDADPAWVKFGNCVAAL